MEISRIERKAIEVVFNLVNDEKRESNIFQDIPLQCDQVGSIINNVNSILITINILILLDLVLEELLIMTLKEKK